MISSIPRKTGHPVWELSRKIIFLLAFLARTILKLTRRFLLKKEGLEDFIILQTATRHTTKEAPFQSMDQSQHIKDTDFLGIAPASIVPDTKQEISTTIRILFIPLLHLFRPRASIHLLNGMNSFQEKVIKICFYFQKKIHLALISAISLCALYK